MKAQQKQVKKKRQRKHDKRWSMKKKKAMKEKKYFKQHDEILETNIQTFSDIIRMCN